MQDRIREEIECRSFEFANCNQPHTTLSLCTTARAGRIMWHAAILVAIAIICAGPHSATALAMGGGGDGGGGSIVTSIVVDTVSPSLELSLDAHPHPIDLDSPPRPQDGQITVPVTQFVMAKCPLTTSLHLQFARSVCNPLAPSLCPSRDKRPPSATPLCCVNPRTLLNIACKEELLRTRERAATFKVERACDCCTQCISPHKILTNHPQNRQATTTESQLTL